MKTPLIIGNWKSHKKKKDVQAWFANILVQEVRGSSAEVILCPPMPLLPLCKELIVHHQLNWRLGAQDVSSFPEGKYTGETNASLMREFADYVLIGHSERRTLLHEGNDLLFEKVKRANEASITPVFFVQGKNTPIPQGIRIVAYEPVSAIGTGHPDSPEDAEEVASFFKKKGVPVVLYGGSVDDKNVPVFMSCSSIDGIVPGTASLDPEIFSRLIKHA